MSPFQQIHVWFRRASPRQRTQVGIALLAALGVLALLIVPAGDTTGDLATDVVSNDLDPSTAGETGTTPVAEDGAVGTPSDGTTSGGVTTPGAPTGGTSAGTGTGTGAGGSATAGPAPAASAGGTACPPGGGQGVTDTTIAVAITIIDLQGLGKVLSGVPEPAEQEAMWRLVADAHNAEGGAGCRKLVPKMYRVNPIDSNSAQSACLRIAAEKPFVVFDTGALSALGNADCIPTQRIPIVSGFMDADQQSKYYPYYLSPTAMPTQTARQGVLALAQQGFYKSADFKKLGFPHQSCFPKLVSMQRQAFREAGVPDSAIVGYDLGCIPGGTSPPTAIAQAVLTFKQQGVTHITPGPFFHTDIEAFSNTAQQQNFRPKYGLGFSPAGTDTGNAQNMDGALAITTWTYGEARTPGHVPSAETAKCDRLFTSKGMPPTYKQGQGYGGVICGYLDFLTRVVKAMPQLQGAAMAAAVPKLGTYTAPFPYGRADFGAAGARSTFGTAHWRTERFHADCSCWRIGDVNWRNPLFVPKP